MDDTDKTIRPNSLDLTDDEAQLIVDALRTYSMTRQGFLGIREETRKQSEAAKALEARIREECGL